MLQHSMGWAAFGASIVRRDAYDLGQTNDNAALLVASLGDPYNTSTFWAEAFRVVRPGGRVLFTIPSYEWSVRFRDKGAGERAEFVLRNGERRWVPSYVPPLPFQIELMESAGFSVLTFESRGAADLEPKEIRSPKIDVFGGEESSLVWGFEVVRSQTSVRR
jgi:hypothetical protein